MTSREKADVRIPPGAGWRNPDQPLPLLAAWGQRDKVTSWITSLQDRNLSAVEIRWPFRLGL
jgi:hypothetical protein